MKKMLLMLSIIFVSISIYAQLPKGPEGKSLYQKGDCITVLPNVKYKCVFCEDEALTVNCKNYDCSLTECVESKTVKNLDGKIAVKPINIEGSQIRIQQDRDSTDKLPKGTILSKGKIMVDTGYKPVYSSDKKMLFILAANGNGVSGTFSCKCGGILSSINCNVVISGGSITCSGLSCCSLTVSTNNISVLTVRELEAAPEKILWKNLVLPKKTN